MLFDPAESKQFNKTAADLVASGQDGCDKLAASSGEYLQTVMREDSFADTIMPAQTVENSDLDRDEEDDRLKIVKDKEPSSPGAISVSFGALPNGLQMEAPRAAIYFDRILSSSLKTDVDRLRSYDMDLRQVMSDNLVKDIAHEKDKRFLDVCSTAALKGGSQLVAVEGGPQGTGDGSNLANAASIESGATNAYTLVDPDGITRRSFEEATKVLPANSSNFEAQTMLINTLTVKEFQKWGRDEIGGDLSQEILEKGWTERELDGKRLIITNKKDLVPTNRIWMFAGANRLGWNYVLEDVTMFIEKKAFNLEFFFWMTQGMTVGNTNACGYVDIVRSAP